jgi:6-phosphogluconolactonase
MLCVNYWDSTLAVIPLCTETGNFTGPIQSMYDPKGGQQMIASGRCVGGVNHSNNDHSTIRMRQADPHSHALVLDPFVGSVAYVPDLGKDLVREFFYDRERGAIGLELNVIPSGLCSGMPDGPRYVEFHPVFPIAYVINELSSTVAVFEVDRALLEELYAASKRNEDLSPFQGRTTLRLIQSIKTTPGAFPTSMNTCGRICVHKSGQFVVVSNRGHQSIAIFRVRIKGVKKGELCAVGFFHTRGETPRHFQFDASGQYLLVANQDSDSIAIFHFNLSSGEIRYTGNKYFVPSPNFICCCPTHDDNSDPRRRETAMVPPLNLVRDNAATAPQQPPMHEVNASSDASSENSYVTTTEAKDDLIGELTRARAEIAFLREQLGKQAFVAMD